MGTIIFVLGFIGLAVLWAFFAWPPEWANEKQVRVFNWSVVAACAMICMAWMLNISVIFDGEYIEKFRWPFAILSALGIEIVFLGIMFLLRNFWVFKPPRPGGKRGWFG